MSKKIDLTGQRFGRLLVIREASKRMNNRITWECKCNCGNYTFVITNSLRRGNTKSCGCYGLEERVKSRTTHKQGGTPTHNTWTSMLARCRNPKRPSYPRYGGKGIEVCDRWLKFENFLEDMGERPPNATLDRKNGDKGYYPGNCRWADLYEQRENQKKSYNGYTFENTIGKYVVRVQFRGQKKYIGCFNTPEEANQAYLEAKNKLKQAIHGR